MKNLSEQFTKKRRRIQGAAWRRLDNTAKLFAAVSGEDLSSVFRISANLKEAVDPELLHRALLLTLPEFENFLYFCIRRFERKNQLPYANL